MDWENFWAVVDKGVRIFSVAGVAIINFASGIYVGIQFLPYDKILANFLFFISAVCPTYLLLSYISDLFEDIRKKDGQNAGSNNAGKS
jgi:hypothetical protein